MTTNSCRTCYDPDCNKAGQDLGACEHHVRMDDVLEDMVVDEATSNPLDQIVFDLSEKIDELRVDLDRLTASIEDILAAVLRARVGEGR